MRTTPPVVEGKFLASIASEVNATLDKEGVTDAKIREEFSAEALREEVDGALAKFTGEKSAVIKAVKDAGFTTEECAVHVLEALTDTGWTDRELVTVAKSLAGLEASGRLERIGSLMRADMAEIDLVKMDYMTLEQIKNKEVGENARALLNNKNLVYDAKGYADCMANYRLYNMTSPILTAITRDFAGANAVDTAKYADYVAKGRDIAAKYASELPEDEAIPLYNFARTLDWSEAKAEESEQALKRRAEEVKPA